MNLTVGFFDNLLEYQKSGNSSPLEDYLYERGNPEIQINGELIYRSGTDPKIGETKRTSDRIVVVTRNS